jgi:NitT/TauT family transport system substrate-binding protein
MEATATTTRPSWRASRLAAMLAGLALVLAACGNGGGTGDDPVGGADAGDDGELFEMEITVTHYPSLLYAVPYIVGIEQGFFEEEGIRITGFAGSEGGGTTVRNVLSGGLPFGEVATPAAANAYISGAPIVAVGGGVQSVAELNWVTTPDSGLDSIEDAVGSTVGYTSPGSVTQGTLNLSLVRAGIDVADVDDRAMGGVGEGLTALDGGAIDIASNMEPVYSRNPDAHDVVWWASDHIEAFQQTIIITSPQMVQDNPDIIEGFLQARARAIDWINENPQEAAEMWAQEGDFEVEAATAALERVLEDDYYGVGFHQDGMSAVDEQMRLIDLVEEDAEIPWDELLDQSFLPDDAESVDPEAIGGGA